MKPISFILAAFLLFSCSDKPKIKAENGVVTDDSVQKPIKGDNPEKINTIFLLVPGISVGLVNLNEPADSLAVFGKPDLSDSAMGKSWSTWLGGHGTMTEELNIYTTYKDAEMNQKVVKLIRVTSAEYKTKDSLGSGNTLSEITKAFPELKLQATYKDKKKDEVKIYDAMPQGIAFEFVRDTCKAAIVHEKGKKATDTYITLHPEMTKL